MNFSSCFQKKSSGKKYLNHSLACGFFFGSLLFSMSAAAQTPAAPSVGMKSISFSGTGCSVDNADAQISPDGQALTVFFSEFTVSSDGSQKSTVVSRKYCDLDISLSAPQGWSYSVLGVDYRGYASLNKKSTVALSTLYKTDARPWKSVKPTYYRGPLTDEYLESRALPIETASWSPCVTKNRFVKLRTIVDLWSAPKNADLFTVDSIDGELSQKFSIQWRQCSVAQTAADDFASRMYEDLIGSDEDTSGVHRTWSDLFLRTKSRYTTAHRAVYSNESRQAYAKSLHQKLLGRAPSAKELSRLVAYYTRENMQLNILASPEYYTNSGSNFQGFLAALQRDVYGNQVNVDFNTWNSLRYNTRHDIARRFVWSETGRVVAIQDALSQLLNRVNPTLDDARHFVPAMGKHPTSEMINVVLMSTEEYIKP